MSRLDDLIRQLRSKDPALADDLDREVAALVDRRAFGLNFERNLPDAVELPGRRVRRGDKVRILPERGTTGSKADERLWRVGSIEDGTGGRVAALEPLEGDGTASAPVDDLVVVAEFRDPVYPGVVSTGKVERGGDKPFHTLINGENYYALQMLLFTHRGKVDCIYIDPPYNTGSKDWKYNNRYVESDDLYRHSKWLAFMERRLLLAKELLRPDDSVLVVTIDENEAARLSLLIEQCFVGWATTHVSIVHNPRGVQGDNFSYIHELAIFVTPPKKRVLGSRRLTPEEVEAGASHLRNWGGESRREDAANCFYPIYVRDGAVVGFGDPVDRDLTIHPEHNEPQADGTVAVWPVDGKGVERKWRYARQTVESIQDQLQVKNVERGAHSGDVDVLIVKTTGSYKTVWVDPKFDASTHGTQLVGSMLDRSFPFPKSLYAVEECLRAAVGHKPDAVVLDFFAGSGTTAHAVMRLNAQDGGRRSSVLVTNNEVAAEEQRTLRGRGLRPGDADWEAAGICEYITKPRVAAAVTGLTPAGAPISGEYRYVGSGPMSEGFAENVEFFTLTYEAPLRVASNREFERIAPLLWMRAGSQGVRIDDISSGWAVAETYGVIAELDRLEEFVRALSAQEGAILAFVVTDEDRLFESVVCELPERLEPVRLYAEYLHTFEIEAGRGAG